MAAESRFFNRELSWLEFDQRVLDEARDPTIPLLERLKFLAITSSNLDEFTMVRVGSLQLLLAEGESRPDPNGLTTTEQLRAIGERMHSFADEQYRVYLSELEPALAQAGMRRVQPQELNDRQRKHVLALFEQEIFPVLTPMAVAVVLDSATSDLVPEASANETRAAKKRATKKKVAPLAAPTIPVLTRTDGATSVTDAPVFFPSADTPSFPPLINQSLSLCVRLAPSAGSLVPRFAIVPFGRNRQRFLTLPSESGFSFILLEDVVGLFLALLFPGETIEECVPFRITRNADLELREDLAFDLLREMQEIVNARREGACVRLEVAESGSRIVREFLQSAVAVADEWVFAVPGPLDLGAFFRLTDSQGFDALRYEQWSPKPLPQVDPAESLFTTIARRDVLLYHPYESFDLVVRLIEEAADDPDVLAIKQTLYRSSAKSPIVAALKRAAQKGKYVTAVVELKARFDELRNIEWARDLERAEVQVIYGVKGLKTHAKVCLIVRREPQGITRYVHFGTGNYNEITSRIYSDVSLMTCNDDLGADATAFFNAITGYSQPQQFRKIEMAPIGLRDKLLEMIEAEAQRKKHGQKAVIMAKFNALVDERMIEALYEASQEGVKIRLNVRGICCLRPGVPGLSENITVTSVVDRFLEHARVFYFYHGGDERLFISSADWMPRNLDRRVELLVPVEDPACRTKLMAIMKTHFQDNVKAKKLLPNGTYERVKPSSSAEPCRSQEVLYRRAIDAIEQAERAALTVFEPHRAPGAEE
ncbi:MAG: polyphosphate kinase 1 [Planctomycetales bacterium]|nr:polyphosphate kinase 1 [Planctomycetales bacterium]